MFESSFNNNFKYICNNPYNSKLEDFSNFVIRDYGAEKFRGKWNKEVFKSEVKLNLELGTGYGHFMLDYCQKYPNENFIGIDYRFKRSYNLAKKLAQLSINNFRFLRASVDRCSVIFSENEVDNIFIFFPDPWIKNKHRKKRIIRPDFINVISHIIKKNGLIYIKTDDLGYFNDIKSTFENNKLFSIEYRSFDLWKDNNNEFLCSFRTKFENIFMKQNIPIKSFVIKSVKQHGF